MRRSLYSLVALGLVLGICLGFLGALHPAFDTIAHFRWHFALMMIVFSLLGVILHIRQVPMILIFFAAIGVWQSDAGNRFGDRGAIASSGAEGKPVTLLHFNLRFDNPLKDQVLAMIKQHNPDILTLNETSRQWTEKLNTLKSDYPYLFHCPEWQAIGGSMVFSKFPMRSDNDYCHAYAALGLSEVFVENRWIDVGVTHIRWPWPASGPSQLEAMEPRLKAVSANAVIAGDFNATTWSHAISKFASLSGMQVARGFGGTWIHERLPTSLAPFFGLPIDNVLTKGAVVLTGVKSLPPTGSDHLPLLVEFRIVPDTQ